MSFSEWRKDKLINLIDTLIDYRGKTPKKTLSGIPLITAKVVKNGFISEPNEFIAIEDYKGWMTRGFPEIGDVVLTVEAPLGEVALIKDTNIALAQRIITLRGKKDLLNSTYLKYFLQSDIGQNRLKERETGTTVTGIKQSELRLVEIDYPSLIKQTKIANILSSLDNKIELNRQTNQTLDTIAQTLFKEWFINNIDKNWGKIIFGELVKPKRGKNITKSQSIDGVYPVVAGGLEPSCYHNEANTSSPVITISSSGANAGFVRLYQSQVWAADCSYIDKSITPFVLFSYVFLKINQHILFDKQVGSAQPHIYPSHIMEMIILNYPTELIDKYEKLVEPIFLNIKHNEEEIQTLTILRDSLLPKLMKGEIKV